MIKFILWYLFIGVLFNLVVDISTDYAKSKGVKVPDQSDWNWSTRLIAGLIWPIGLVYYLRGYIQEINKNKK